jgi:hypothetical protein
MNITEKYIFVRLIEPTFWRMQGIQPANPNSGKLFTFGGIAKGENSHGIWLAVDASYDPEINQVEPQGPPLTMLIPWADAVAVLAFDTKPLTPPIGFRPR